MPLEYTLSSPWLDNWPIRFQLWNPGATVPGNELDLSPQNKVSQVTTVHPISREPVTTDVTTPRLITVQFRRQADNTIDAAFNEESSSIALDAPKRGVISIQLSRADWEQLAEGVKYTIEVIAYGFLYLEQSFSAGRPEPGRENLNGVEIYGSPRQVLELLGPVPGASVEVSRDLSGEWNLDDRGYWTKPAPQGRLFGLWIDDLHARKVDYRDLALSSDRAWSIAGGNIYYKGSEDLSESYVETAYSIYVWRCLKEATAEAERRTGRFFNLQRVIREVHRGLNRHRQLVPRGSPVRIDTTFRLDALSYTRSLYRRYTEEDFDTTDGFFSGGQVLHCDLETGVITINQNVWDWWDWGNNQSADYGLGQFAYLPHGENNIELTYVAGFEKTPPDIDEAVCNLAAVRQGIFWNQAITQGLQGMNIGCMNMNFSDLFSQWFPAWTQGADQILDAYQNLEVEGL